ncbi:MAG: TetR/AcrR family transcriptional regulator [Gammaproteobacteria bacterium]|nr:TetR/AcrR family transcriptional regulator [Gammaproteobacteria bacterium]
MNTQENAKAQARPTKRTEASREKILAAASELFLNGGVSALSVRAIAKHAGLSTIGIYSHFNGKQGVLDALYIEGFNKVYKAMDLGDAPLTYDNVVKSCKNYLQMAYQHEAHYRLIFGESDTSYEPSAEAREAGDRAFKKLVHNSSCYIATNNLQLDKLKASLDLWAVMHGYVSISHHARANEKLPWAKMALDAAKVQLNSWK